MRHTGHIFVFFALSLLLSACENDTLVGVQSSEYSAPKYLVNSNWGWDTSELDVTVSYSGTLSGGGSETGIRYAKLLISSKPDMSAVVERADLSVYGHRVSGKIEFSPDGSAAYYAQARVGSSAKDYIASDVYNCKIPVPVLTTNIYDIGWYAVDIGTEVSSFGLDVNECGVLLSCTNTDPVLNAVGVRYGKYSGKGNSYVDRWDVADAADDAGLDMSDAPTYYLRTYAITSAGTGYGPVVSFKTIKWPEVTDEELTDITTTSATYNYTVVKAPGDNSVITEGLRYGSSADNTDKEVKGHIMTSLAPNTTYYCRYFFYDSHGEGIERTDAFSFTTLSSTAASAAKTVPVITKSKGMTAVRTQVKLSLDQ